MSSDNESRSRSLLSVVLPLLGVLVAAVLAACGSSSRSATPAAGNKSGQVLQVVAAENFWGNIAAHIGGSHVAVKSIISDPNADPHAYEPTAADGRLVATSRMMIVNGIGYDQNDIDLVCYLGDPVE